LSLLDRLFGALAPRSGLSLVGSAFATIALVVAVGVGYQTLQLSRDLEQVRSENTSLRSELSQRQQLVFEALSPGAIAWNLSGTESAPSARGTLYCRKNSRVGILTATDLPPLSSGRAYQLWLIRDGQRLSGGMLTVDPAGRGVLTIQAPEPLGDYQYVGMTEEPYEGSAGPTGQRVLSGQIY
jgi:hypothetical protein